MVVGNIIVEIDSSFFDILASEAVHAKEYIEIISTDKFGSEPKLVQAMISLNDITIPIIKNIIVEALRKKKYVNIKKNGLSVSSIDENNALNILMRL